MPVCLDPVDRNEDGLPDEPGAAAGEAAQEEEEEEALDGAVHGEADPENRNELEVFAIGKSATF